MGEFDGERVMGRDRVGRTVSREGKLIVVCRGHIEEEAGRQDSVGKKFFFFFLRFHSSDTM